MQFNNMRFAGFLFLIALSSCYTAGSKSRPCIYKGHFCSKDKIYNYPDGKKLHLETLIYKHNQLVYEKTYYERWPNGEYKKIGDNGFVKLENGASRLDDPSLKIPDDILVPYFDKNLEQQYWVYMNGQKMPYRSGYTEGTQVDIHTGDKPGVYVWKDAQLVFLREYDPNEKARYENAVNVLHSNDSLKTK